MYFPSIFSRGMNKMRDFISTLGFFGSLCTFSKMNDKLDSLLNALC